MIVSEVGHQRLRPRFAGGFEPGVRDQRDFLGEALHVLGFLREKAHRDEQREVRILVARRLEHVVQGALHQLPQAVAVGSDDHAATHR